MGIAKRLDLDARWAPLSTVGFHCLSKIMKMLLEAQNDLDNRKAPTTKIGAFPIWFD